MGKGLRKVAEVSTGVDVELLGEEPDRRGAGAPYRTSSGTSARRATRGPMTVSWYGRRSSTQRSIQRFRGAGGASAQPNTSTVRVTARPLVTALKREVSAPVVIPAGCCWGGSASVYG